MRVVHVIPGLVAASGGPTTALVGLASAQSRAGDVVTVVTTLRRGQEVAHAESLARSGVTLMCVGPCYGPLAFHRDLAATVDREVRDADVVHVHGVWEDIQFRAAASCQRRQVPYVIRTCGLLDEWSLRVKPLRKWIYRRWRLDAMLGKAAAVHCTTEMERVSTGAAVGRVPFITEPNGVSLDDFRVLPDGTEFRSRYGLSGRPVIGFLGRIHAGKGLECLIPSLARMRCRDAVLVAAGPDSGGFRAVMEQLATRHRVRDRLIFTGMIHGSSKVEMLASCDVMAFPSEHENFGIAVVEAMAAGRPVIVSDQVGIRSDVLKAGCGAVVPLDTDAVAAELDSWVADGRRCREAGERGRTFATVAYDWDRIAERWKHHYQGFAARRRS